MTAKKPAPKTAEKAVEPAAPVASKTVTMTRGSRTVAVPANEVDAHKGGGWKVAK